ncbi:exodeoxyribonuclease V subunit alpha [Vibrio sp.]|uniref:exodeoxyribonuclease V subunit alpha n=1 Tax=Vibrio sp. TaxID=678 RepID=UPI003D0ECBE3
MIEQPLIQLMQWVKQGTLRQLDYQFARFMLGCVKKQALSSQQQQMLLFISAAISAELGRGHICLPLFDQCGQKTALASKLGLHGDLGEAVNELWYSIDWQALVTQCSIMGAQQDVVPLIFDGRRLYLHRYWQYEATLAEYLQSFGTPMSLKLPMVQNLKSCLDELFARNYQALFMALQDQHDSSVIRQRLVCDWLDVVEEEALDWQAIDAVLVRAQRASDLVLLDELVPERCCINWQKVAAAIALTRRFAVISGGPGTGKTTTVTKLLAALVRQVQQQGKTPLIKLVAPTGKAAARLTESIGQAVAKLAIDPALKARIPTESSTLHRLLGAIPQSAEFRHHRKNPLHVDILVVDEASMVDLPMMSKLVEALPIHAQLILLGDKDQLASVEAGAVLGDICSFVSQGYSMPQRQRLAELTGFSCLTSYSTRALTHPLADSLCMLQKSYRFDARSGIGQLAKAINCGDVEKLHQVWQQGFCDIEHFPITSDNYRHLLQTLVEAYSGYLQRMNQSHSDPLGQPESMQHKAQAVLTAFSRCRLLCAVREGQFGVQGLNLRIERALAVQKQIQYQDEQWYAGRPIMISQNDHALGLYNGDIGVCLPDDNDPNRRLKVYFELPNGQIKAVLPSRVPAHETAYAMTIHKSQGSEFDFTLLILPPNVSPIMTRELIYTAVTRAKQRLALYADMAVLKRCITVKTERASGLVERLMQAED